MGDPFGVLGRKGLHPGGVQLIPRWRRDQTFPHAQGQEVKSSSKSFLLVKRGGSRSIHLMSDRQLKRSIADLKAMERKAFGSRRRFGFYVYLAAVYALYVLLRRNNEAKISAHRIAELFDIRIQKRTHSIRVIIDATSAGETKMKPLVDQGSAILLAPTRKVGRYSRIFEGKSWAGGCSCKVVCPALARPKRPSRAGYTGSGSAGSINCGGADIGAGSAVCTWREGISATGRCGR